MLGALASFLFPNSSNLATVKSRFHIAKQASSFNISRWFLLPHSFFSYCSYISYLKLHFSLSPCLSPSLLSASLCFPAHLCDCSFTPPHPVHTLFLSLLPWIPLDLQDQSSLGTFTDVKWYIWALNSEINCLMSTLVLCWFYSSLASLPAEHAWTCISFLKHCAAIFYAMACLFSCRELVGFRGRKKGGHEIDFPCLRLQAAISHYPLSHKDS